MALSEACRWALPLLAAVFLQAQVSAAAWGTESDQPTAVVHVNVAKDVGPANRSVLGNNALGYQNSGPEYSARGAGLWDPARHESVRAMIELAKATGVRSLRWPGGCAAHLFNWKLTVGPTETRPNQAFGLAEFLQVAEEIGAEPVITIADYWGSENDAADLVEYLNAPVGQNTNGGIDWAAVRARQGHTKPYNVKWFEFGNETDHGPHVLGTPPAERGVPLTADEYVRRFHALRSAMKAVDPSIRLGAVLGAETGLPLSAWSQAVIRGSGDVADFMIYHAYLPRTTDNSGAIGATDLFELAYATAPQLSAFLRQLGAEIEKQTGRMIPLGITEFNGLFQQDRPKPYRLSEGAAVLVADMALAFLDPSNRVAFANYWQLSNEYWGMIKGYGPVYTKRPAWYVFKMLNDHLGDRLVELSVQSGSYSTRGGMGLFATAPAPSRFKMHGDEQQGFFWNIRPALGVSASSDRAGTITIRLPAGVDVNYHHAAIDLSATGGLGYRVTAEIRTEGLERTSAQLEVIDGRGWDATGSSSLSNGVRNRNWTPVTVDYVALPDAKSVDIRVRRLGGVAEGGKIEVRNVRLRTYAPDRATGIPYLGALASRGPDGRVSVFLVNRDVRHSLRLTLTGLPAGYSSAWSLTGAAVDSNNEIVPDEVTTRPMEVTNGEQSIALLLPPHSFSVLVTSLRPAQRDISATEEGRKR